MLAAMLPSMPMLAIHDALHSAAHAHGRLSLGQARVTEADDAFTIEADAPGVAATDAKIEYESESNSVRIHGSSTRHAHTHLVDYRTSFGARTTDADKAVASIKDGIITVTLPKAAESEAEVSAHVRIPVPGSASDESGTAADDAYRLTLVAAGFNASEITVEAQANAIRLPLALDPRYGRQQDGLLRISGESARIKRKRLDEVYRLPRDADATAATASQLDGILTIHIPKRPAPVHRRIQIALGHEQTSGTLRKLPETTTADQGASGSSSSAANQGDEEPAMV